jgi:hypothetical protein
MLSVIMLNVTYKPFVLNVVMLTVVGLNVIMLSVVASSCRPLSLAFLGDENATKVADVNNPLVAKKAPRSSP